MKRLVYNKMLRKAAKWGGPCPACGREIHVGDVIRQPFKERDCGTNYYEGYWVCNRCAMRLHGQRGFELICI